MTAKELGQQPATAIQVHNLAGPTNEIHSGLTKREYFAAMAMAGMLGDSTTTDVPSTKIALYSVECADALLSELAKEQ
jgi:hypothetical protein